MSLARGKYGIEYVPRSPDDDPSLLGLAAVLVLVAALVTATYAIGRRILRRAAAPEAEIVQTAPAAPEPGAVTNAPALPAAPAIAERAIQEKRPVKVRNLLLRLREAERARDVEMAISTIEQLRSLPGNPAADLDDSLARRLGALNLHCLWNRPGSSWTTEVTVKAGDAAQRIAREHGSTLSSLMKLNSLASADRIVIGQKLRVMNHPRFNLVIRRRSRTADLSLNGKFFRRYDTVGEIAAAAGTYVMPERPRELWKRLGAVWSERDRAELETLLPAGASVLVSEL